MAHEHTFLIMSYLEKCKDVCDSNEFWLLSGLLRGKAQWSTLKWTKFTSNWKERNLKFQSQDTDWTTCTRFVYVVMTHDYHGGKKKDLRTKDKKNEWSWFSWWQIDTKLKTSLKLVKVCRVVEKLIITGTLTLTHSHTVEVSRKTKMKHEDIRH